MCATGDLALVAESPQKSEGGVERVALLITTCV